MNTTQVFVSPNDFKRVNNDVNGNPRYVCHYTHFILDAEKEIKPNYAYSVSKVSIEYNIAIKRANKLGGRNFHNKQYGGGIVFQSYNIEDICKHINEMMNNL
jgi:hypothetical protein